MSHDVFISYSSEDKNVADAVCSYLENNEIRTWIAPRDITPGKKWGEEIVNAIAKSEIMVLIFSSSSNQSQQVLREVERAVNKDVIIIPFRIEETEPTKSMEYFLYSTHWLDAIDSDLEANIEKLNQTVKKILANDDLDFIDDKDKLIEEIFESKQLESRSLGQKIYNWTKSNWKIAVAALLLVATISYYGIIARTPEEKLLFEAEIIGSGELELEPMREDNKYQLGEEIQISATPQDDFIEWQGSLTGDKAVETLTVRENMELTARFKGDLPGDGSLENPYQISHSKDLVMLTEGDLALDAHYQLIDDIDLESKSWEPIGEVRNHHSNDYTAFTGSFCGQGYVIENLEITDADNIGSGLFAVIDEGARISNLGIVGTEIYGDQIVGGLVAWNKDGIIEQSYLDEFKVEGQGNMIGGLAGYNQGEIKSSFVSGEIKGDNLVGALVGLNDFSATISDSYARAYLDVGPRDSSGALVGSNRSLLSNSYAISELNQFDNRGGLVGTNNHSSSRVENSYWNIELLDVESSSAAVGKTTTELKEQATFVDWDFDETWAIDETGAINDGFPYLQWQE